MENKTVSEFDILYSEKWEELVKGGVSTLDDQLVVFQKHTFKLIYMQKR